MTRARVCRGSVGVPVPCAACLYSCGFAGCVSPCECCVGTDGSISRLPDHLWIPAALPSVSRLGSACQLANAGHLSVPLHLRSAAHLYPCLRGGRAVAGRTGLGSALRVRGASLVRLGFCSASPGTGPLLRLCSRPLSLPGTLWKTEAGVCVSVCARMHECGRCCMHIWCKCAGSTACMFGCIYAAALCAYIGLYKQSGLCSSSQGCVCSAHTHVQI